MDSGIHLVYTGLWTWGSLVSFSVRAQILFLATPSSVSNPKEATPSVTVSTLWGTQAQLESLLQRILGKPESEISYANFCGRAMDLCYGKFA